MIERSEHPPSDPREPFFIFALILLTLATFLPVVMLDFVGWDDPIHISENPRFHPPSMTAIAAYWQRPYAGLYIPLTNTLWMLNAMVAYNPQTGWLSSAMFHAMNLLTHVGCVVMVYLILRKLGNGLWPATIGAAIFAVHPLQVETVAWVSGFRDLLSALFLMIAVWLYLKRANVACFICFLLAILSKPTAIVAAPICVCMGLFQKRPWKQTLRETAPLFLMAIACIIWTGRIGAFSSVEHSPLWSRPLTAADALAFYLFKLIWPATLGFDYGRTPRAILESGQAYFTWIVPLGVIVVLAFVRHRLWILAAAVFVVGLLPVSGLIDFQEESTVADRYVYISMLGIGIAVAGIMSVRKSMPLRSVLIGIILLLAARSWMQTWTWRNTRTLAEHGLMINPRSWSSKTLLANVAFDDLDLLRAEKLSREAMEIHPDDADALINLGRALALQDRVSEAVPFFERAAAKSPNDPQAHASLAAAYGELGRIEEALKECETALKLDPYQREARIMLPRLRQAASMPATTQSLP